MIGIVYNEITVQNFVVQTRQLENKIITLKPDCYNESRGWFSNTRYKIGENFNKIAHEELYHYLYKKNIIEVKLHTLENFFALNVFNKSNIYQINKNLIIKDPVKTEETLRAIINENNEDFPQLLTCYDMNYGELTKFLINYKYSPIDVIPIGPFGGRNKTRVKQKTKNKTKKRSIKRMKRKTFRNIRE
jgi:hypothetical protein